MLRAIWVLVLISTGASTGILLARGQTLADAFTANSFGWAFLAIYAVFLLLYWNDDKKKEGGED